MEVIILFVFFFLIRVMPPGAHVALALSGLEVSVHLEAAVKASLQVECSLNVM